MLKRGPKKEPESYMTLTKDIWGKKKLAVQA